MFPRLSGSPLPSGKERLSCPSLPWWPDLSPLREKPLGHCVRQNPLLLFSWPAAPGRPSCYLSCPGFLFCADRESLWVSGCKFLVTWRLLGPSSCSQQAFHSSLKVWLDLSGPSLWRSCPFFCCCVKSGLATCLPFDIPAGGCSLSSAFWCFQETLHFCRLGCSFSPLGREWCWPTLYISVESGSLPHERTIWKDAEVLVNRLLLLVWFQHFWGTRFPCPWVSDAKSVTFKPGSLLCELSFSFPYLSFFFLIASIFYFWLFY